MECGAELYGHSGCGGGFLTQVQLRQWPEAVGMRADEKGYVGPVASATLPSCLVARAVTKDFVFTNYGLSAH